MPSLISILSSQSSSRFANALSKETRRFSYARSVALSTPRSLVPAAITAPAVSAAANADRAALDPARERFSRHFRESRRCGLHLIRGDAFDLRLQDPSTMAVSRADVAGDASISSSIRLADLISEYFEDCDEESDALDGLTTLRTERSAQAQFHETASFLPAMNHARSNLGSLGEEANQRLSADYLDGQMHLTEQNQVRMVQSLAAMDGPVESALYADVIAAMTDARACHANDLRGSSLNAAVAGRLRAMGYDAAVCTTQWDTSLTMPEGGCHTRVSILENAIPVCATLFLTLLPHVSPRSYEYIDVLVSTKPLSRLPPSASPCSARVSFTSPAPASPSPTFTRTTPSTTAPRPSLPPCAASSVSADGASPSPASADGASPSPTSVTPQRFVVDLDFRAQFQIARPTREHASVLESTPLIFVGRQERLARLVEVVSGVMREALRAQGMHIPPWRKGEYLHAKWMAADGGREDGNKGSSAGV
ncbi:unnamed protein product [Closterium sp. Yama58-4]|nr:unnamed protein product [Closterium sp. Yama58-4]